MASYYLTAHNRARRPSDLMTPSRWLPIPLLVQNFECGNKALLDEGTFKEKKKTPKTNELDRMTGFQCSLDTNTHCTHTYIPVYICRIWTDIPGKACKLHRIIQEIRCLVCFFSIYGQCCAVAFRGTRRHQSSVCTHDSCIGGLFIASHLKNCYMSTMKRCTQRGVCLCGAAGETRPCFWELMCIVSSATSLLKHFECFRLSESETGVRLKGFLGGFFL